MKRAEGRGQKRGSGKGKAKSVKLWNPPAAGGVFYVGWLFEFVNEIRKGRKRFMELPVP